VPDEVAAARIRIGGRVLHLPHRIDRLGAHGEERGRLAVMEMAVVVLRTPAFVDQEAERHVEGFFAGSADPEEPVPLPVHLDQALFEHPRFHHQRMHLQQQIRRELRGGGRADGPQAGAHELVSLRGAF